jgi:hypothetical protein
MSVYRILFFLHSEAAHFVKGTAIRNAALGIVIQSLYRGIGT